MNSILKFFSIKSILVITGLSLAAFVFFVQYEFQKPRPDLFGPVWSLEDLQHYFVGDLPQNATDIQYQSHTSYGLLSFKASPSDALAFAQRFCYGSLLTGYDPFNSFDTNDNKSGDGFLIQTESGEFYYSHPTHIDNTLLGNRCSDIRRGGIHQLVVYTQDKTQYLVKLEISATCTNQTAPHPCDGNPVSYSKHGYIKLNTTYEIDSRYAEGDNWEISLEPRKQYSLLVKPKQGQQDLNRHDFQANTSPSIVTGNEPYL